MKSTIKSSLKFKSLTIAEYIFSVVLDYSCREVKIFPTSFSIFFFSSSLFSFEVMIKFSRAISRNLEMSVLSFEQTALKKRFASKFFELFS
jgi:hypothetical protein